MRCPDCRGCTECSSNELCGILYIIGEEPHYNGQKTYTYIHVSVIQRFHCMCILYIHVHVQYTWLQRFHVLLQLKNADYFSQFVTEDFEQYINRKRSDHSYGNNLEMQAMAEMYNRAIEVHQYSIGQCCSMCISDLGVCCNVFQCV